jgi:hypothetical protein
MKEVKDLCSENYKSLKKELEKLERCPMLMDQQNQYRGNGYTTKSNLYV